MGAMQAYHWAALFPDMVERIAVVCGFRVMGRVYAGWALSQTFYRQELWRTLGCTPSRRCGATAPATR